MISDLLYFEFLRCLNMESKVSINYSALRLNYCCAENADVYWFEEGTFSSFLLYLFGQFEHCKCTTYTGQAGPVSLYFLK